MDKKKVNSLDVTNDIKNETPQYMQNRELSWLRFNERVLEEAQDINVPLLERLKFVAIFTSNLDEFFMIRVGSLYDLTVIGADEVDNKTGWSPLKQLGEIYKKMPHLYEKRDQVYREIMKELDEYSISAVTIKDLVQKEQKYVKTYFKLQILPILSPQVVDTNHPFPHMSSKAIYVVAVLKTKGNTTKLGMIPVPAALPAMVFIPGNEIRFIPVEQIIMEYLPQIFEMYTVSEANYICVTRNADISPNDESFDIEDDFRGRMQKLLSKRRRLAVVRLESGMPLSPWLKDCFCDKLKISENQMFYTETPMSMSFAFSLADKVPISVRHTLTYTPFTPAIPIELANGGSIIKQVKRQDILLFYPYESMDPFLKLIKEVANDNSVISIKITIYRLAQKARLVEYLCAAAENGKDVTIVIELRARFDEQNNIDWSERLEEAGCRVIYGFEDFKVHSKVCLITRRERNEINYITQIGTGNYNEKTAEMYTDLSLITANKVIGAEASAFFKNMALANLDGHYDNLLVAPYSMKNKIIDLINREIEKKSDGHIMMKLNSITDYTIIQKLTEASCSGVKIQLIVRGICCILPGVPGKTENISVISIVGRFLEHPRVYVFGTGEDQVMYISSADMMTRNTQRRVEVACPVFDKKARQRILHILEVQLSDNLKARKMTRDGTYATIDIQQGPELDSQQVFMSETEDPQAYVYSYTHQTKKKETLWSKLKSWFR